MAKTKIRQVLPKGKRKKSEKKTSSSTPVKEAKKRVNPHPGGPFQKGNTIGKDTRFPPGVSGNPAGRPKGLDMTTAFRKVLEKPARDVPSAVTQAERLGIDLEEDKTIRVVDVLMEATVSHIMMGKGDILKQGWERIEGAVKQNFGLNEDDPVMDYLDFMKQTTEP